MRQHECILTRWSLVVAAGKGSHLPGAKPRIIRVSTAVRAFDPDGPGGPEAVTASGSATCFSHPENSVSVFLDLVGQRYDLL